MARHLILGVLIALFTLPALDAQDKFLGKTADAWAAQLKAADVKARRGAAYALGKMGRGSLTAMPAMRDALAKEKDASVRDALLYAMGEICRETKTAELEPVFIAALQDKDPYARRSAAFALRCLGTKSAATRAALEAALTDDIAIVRQNAIWALVQFNDAALPSFAKGLRDPDSDVKRESAAALLHVGDGDKVHALVKDLLPLCQDRNSEVRKAAVNVLVRIVDPSDKDAIPVLAEALKDSDPEVRRTAALALSNIGGDATAVALKALLDAARNADLELRRQAVLAIRNIGPAAAPALDDLKGFLENDPDAKMRAHAALALGGLVKAGEPAYPLLVKKIQDRREDAEVRRECAMALARMGSVPSAAQHAPALLAVLADANQDALVRERIVWALRVHAGKLRKIDGAKEAFTKILGEPKTPDNRMLRYDSAYMLGMIWQLDAPDGALEVLLDFLKDDTIKIYVKTDTVVPGGTEAGAGKSKLDERGEGDGRVMAADALLMIGQTRVAGRPELVRQLRALADDARVYLPLRKKAQELLK